MILGTIKTFIIVSMTYVVLSFQISGHYIFDHLTEIIGPIGETIQSSLGDSFNQSWERTKEASSKLFTNSTPRYQNKVNKPSQMNKTKVQKRHNKTYLEELRAAETEKLNSLIIDE